MSDWLELALRAAAIGIGATAIMDLWNLFLGRVFGARSPDYAMVGRWLGHIPRGRLAHASIGAAETIAGERAIGWIAHYLIGIAYAAVLLAAWGLDWAREPTLPPALIVGVVTVVAPFFLMQPGMGLGIAGSKTPRPNAVRLRSLLTHTVFGVGLYLSAQALSLWRV
jgi:hypothetical protein